MGHADTIAWDVRYEEGMTVQLHYSADAELFLSAEGVGGGEAITLAYDEAGLSADVLARFPQLEGFDTFHIPEENLAQVPDILRDQIAVSVVDAEGALVDATSLQIPGVLDDLYTYDGQLGIIYNADVPSLALWAPTARNVSVHLFADPDAEEIGTFPMTLDPETGVWSVTGDASWTYKFYLYEVEVYAPSTGNVEHNLVTDPYSLSLSMNSTRSQIVDLMNDTVAEAAGLARTWKNRRWTRLKISCSTNCTSAISASSIRPCPKSCAAPTWPSPCRTPTA